jgi:hypothetical protein
VREDTSSRRGFLKRSLLSVAAGSLAILRPKASLTAEAALLSPNDPAAKALRYTEDAGSVKGIPAGNKCSNCALYQGSYTSTAGPCQAFPGKQVKAAGWCSSWTAQM